MVNYTNIDGVTVSEWSPESEANEPDSEWVGEIDGMYFDNGSLVIIIAHPDGDTVTDIQIPVKAKRSWNGFVESLPQWE